LGISSNKLLLDLADFCKAKIIWRNPCMTFEFFLINRGGEVMGLHFKGSFKSCCSSVEYNLAHMVSQISKLTFGDNSLPA